MSRAVKGEPEPPHCVQYHEYMDSLAKMKNDMTIPMRQRWAADVLHSSISVHHMKQCVPEAYEK